MYSLTAFLAPNSQVSVCKLIVPGPLPTFPASGKVHAGEIEPWAIFAQAKFATAFVGDFDVIIATIVGFDVSDGFPDCAV